MTARERHLQQYCELSPGGRIVMESHLTSGSWVLGLALFPFTLGLSLALPFTARRTIRRWREAAEEAS